MRRAAKLISLFLLALWLPATAHCQLEALGLHEIFACADAAGETAHRGGQECTDNGCLTLESGQVMVSKDRLDLGSAALVACLGQICLLHVAPPAAEPDVVAPRQDETLPLQRTWQFARRAALPARAPGLNA